MASDDQLLAQALSDPKAALVEIEARLAVVIDPQERPVILRAQGIAQRELGELELSERALREALALGSTDEVATTSMTLASTLLLKGQIDSAIGLLNYAITNGSTSVRIEAEFQMGTVMARVGRFDQALSHYGAALPGIRRLKRTDWEAHLLGNRGAVRMELGHYREAKRDLDRALAKNQALEHPMRAAMNQRNLAELEFLQGDVMRSLHTYGLADDVLRALGVPEEALADKAHSLMAAGLFLETARLMKHAFAEHRAKSNVLGQLDSAAYAVEALLALGDHEGVAAVSDLVATIEGSDAFPGWVARIELGAVRGRLRASAVTELDRERCERALSSMRDSGDALRVAEAHLTAVDLYRRLENHVVAGVHLEAVRRAMPRLPLHVQLQAWLFEAEARYSGFDQRNPRRAVSAGLAVHDRLMQSVSNYEIRARSSQHGDKLLSLSVRMRLERSQLKELAEEVEGFRVAVARSVPDASDAPIALQSALRELSSTRVAVQAGSASPAKLTRMERTVASLSRSADRRGAVLRSAHADQRPMIGNCTFLTYVVDDGCFSVVANTDGAYSLHRCGDVERIVAEVERLSFLGRQLALRRQLSAKAVRDLRDAHTACAEGLDELMLPSDLADQVVVSPDPSLGAMMWPALPRLTQRSFVLAPSLRESIWAPSKRTRARCVAVACPEVPHAGHEVQLVAAHYSTEALLSGPVDLAERLDGAEVAHLAGHFLAESDNPLLASMPLGDGVLTAYDFMAMRAAPRVVVLSGCSTGIARPLGTHAAIGFAAAIRSAGTQVVIATNVPVEDGAPLVAIMDSFHSLLCAGQPPAEVLRELRMSASTDEKPATDALVVFGRGLRGPG